MKRLRQDSRFPARESNKTPPVYTPEALLFERTDWLHRHIITEDNRMLLQRWDEL
jgi:hypothetical protein